MSACLCFSAVLPERDKYCLDEEGKVHIKSVMNQLSHVNVVYNFN